MFIVSELTVTGACKRRQRPHSKLNELYKLYELNKLYKLSIDCA